MIQGVIIKDWVKTIIKKDVSPFFKFLVLSLFEIFVFFFELFAKNNYHHESSQLSISFVVANGPAIFLPMR